MGEGFGILVCKLAGIWFMMINDSELGVADCNLLTVAGFLLENTDMYLFLISRGDSLYLFNLRRDSSHT